MRIAKNISGRLTRSESEPALKGQRPATAGALFSLDNPDTTRSNRSTQSLRSTWSVSSKQSFLNKADSFAFGSAVTRLPTTLIEQERARTPGPADYRAGKGVDASSSSSKRTNRTAGVFDRSHRHTPTQRAMARSEETPGPGEYPPPISAMQLALVQRSRNSCCHAYFRVALWVVVYLGLLCL